MIDRSFVRFHRITAGIVLIACAGCARADGSEDSTTRAPDGGNGSMLQEATNTLTAVEVSEGFELLFDGETLQAWRGFNRDDLSGGWSAVDGTLTYTPGVESGDIITRAKYTDFELRLEWKVGPGGNSGVMFGIVEGILRTYESGPEMQVLDNAGHRDGQNPLTSAGSNYGLHAPPRDVTRAVGEWNQVRIVREGNHVEHWLNGTKVVDYELGSAEWKARVAETKFAEWPDYGAHHEGHIGLQDHGDPVSYRNLRIRRLDS